MKIIKFILFLLPWFISSLFVSDTSFYQNLNLPFFAPPTIVFPIVWTIIYILIAISIYIVYSQYKYKDIKSYNISLITNYIFNQLFVISFFVFQSPFLGFINTLIVLITSIILYDETKKLNLKASKWLIPYLIWNLFALILSLTIYFMNF